MKRILILGGVLAMAAVSPLRSLGKTDPLHWMSQLSDYDYVCQLSIPGTHDTGTGNGFEGIGAVGGLVAGKNQEKSFASQLKLGVRAFDLRPGVDGSTLPVFHGPLKTKLTMNKAFTECISFLTANPSEFVIFIIRHETEGDNNNSKWAGNMTDHCNKYDDIIVPFSPKLKVGEARGKVVVITRSAFTYSKAGAVSGWGDNATFRTGSIKSENGNATLWLQDNYEISGTDAKNSAVVSLLDKSATLCRDESAFGKWVINHASGYKGSATNSNISSNAKNTAKAIIQRLGAADYTPGPTGIVLMDFAGTDAAYDGTSLVDAIIDNNARYHKGIIRLPVPNVRWEELNDGSKNNVLLQVTAGDIIPGSINVQHIAYDSRLRSLGDKVSSRTYGEFSKGFKWNFSGSPAALSPIYRVRLSGGVYLDSEETICVFNGGKITLEPELTVDGAPLEDGRTVKSGQAIRVRKVSSFEASGPFGARKVAAWNPELRNASSAFTSDGEYGTFVVPASLAGTSLGVTVTPSLESGMDRYFAASPRTYTLHVAADTPTGVDDVDSPEDVNVEVYTVDGVRVTGKSLPKGVYIVRKGKSVKKMIK